MSACNSGDGLCMRRNPELHPIAEPIVERTGRSALPPTIMGIVRLDSEDKLGVT